MTPQDAKAALAEVRRNTTTVDPATLDTRGKRTRARGRALQALAKLHRTDMDALYAVALTEEGVTG